MVKQKIYQQIRKEVESFLPDVKIILFGSQASSDSDILSDYDLLIITPQSLTPKEKIQLSSTIDKALVEALKIPVDLLINSEEEILVKQTLPGHIIASIMREGIEI